MMYQFTQVLNNLRYNPQVRAMTNNQIEDLMNNELEKPDPRMEHVLAFAAMATLKAEGAIWSLRQFQKGNTNALLSAQERRIKALIKNSRTAFADLLKVLGVELKDSINSSKNKDNSSESRVNLSEKQQQSLNSLLDSQIALLELMWEQLPVDIQNQFIDLLQDD